VSGFVQTTNRLIKAKKIESVLSDYYGVESIAGLKILDIGCGSGLIAEYFSKNNHVTCVDVEDKLMLTDRAAISFEIVVSAKLPFSDNAFDIVISNHVIEHLKEQEMHLIEINRILKPDGACYFTTPNRTFPLEPHYRIPLIHYLPNKMFHWLLKIIGKYQEDLHLLSYKEMLKLFQICKFDYREFTTNLLKYPEKYNMDSGYHFSKYLPMTILRLINRIVPGNIFVLSRKAENY
jgi:2-polyprenyl-3-methyl-5-hydroxy-6-metoxy-1,4-benzoquinol methylase